MVQAAMAEAADGRVAVVVNSPVIPPAASSAQFVAEGNAQLTVIAPDGTSRTQSLDGRAYRVVFSRDGAGVVVLDDNGSLREVAIVK
jgi:3-oxoacyl-[acyl-carrier-protein] synthase III